MNFTTQQAAAIAHDEGALLVSAAAGSGKTAVLVERAVRLLCRTDHPIPADRLLIVTFTRAAAASLRAKLSQRLDDEIAKNPAGTQLRRQRMLLQRASICTIDSYCLKLVQNHFNRLDIPPDFSTADGPQLEALRRQALADAMENAYLDPDFCAFSDLYGKGRSDRQAADVLEQLHDFLTSLPRPETVLEQFRRDWQSGEDLAATRWGQALIGEARQAVACALKLAGENLEDAREDGGLDNYLPALEADLEAAETIARVLDSGSWDQIVAAMRGLSYQRFKAVRGYSGWAMDIVKERRELFKKTFARLNERVFACTGEEFESDRRAAAPLVAALIRAERDFNKRFMQAKLEEKLLEFSDVEQLALQLLQNPDGTPTELAGQVGGDFEAVMVDEYQDTNALQDALYACLAKPGGEDLFFVGDLKQSIYRFRQADPGIFSQKLESYGEYGQPGPQKLFLDANFRSAPGVISGINSIFEPIMTPGLGGVTYGDGERLRPGFGGLDDYGGYEGGCELAVVQDGGPAAEAEYIACKIQDMTGPGSDFVLRDGNEATRPARYEDFCILLRSRGNFETYAQALEAKGIPVYVDRALNLLETPEVLPVASLLRVLDNPAQDVHLAAVMLRLAGFVPDDLVRIRAACPKGSFYGAVRAAEDKKTTAFAARLLRLRQLSQTLPADQLVEEIFLDTGWLAAVGAMPDGEVRRANLRRFADFVTSVGKNGLSGVVRAMDAALEGKGLPGPEQGQSRPGCVTIMTVHRSKGLEFPVVFAAGLSHSFNKEDLRAAAVFHKQLGIGLTLRAGQGGVYATAAYLAVQSALAAEGLSEEMRVLYVALTRARDHLILTMNVKNIGRILSKMANGMDSQGKPDEYLLRQCQSPAEWVLAAMLTHPAAGELQELTDTEVPVRLEHAAEPFTVVVTQMPEAEAAEPPVGGLPVAEPDAELLKQVEEQLAWTYPKADLEKIPAKVSVTALVHEAGEAVLERPSFLYSQGITAAERGTAVHAFLQYADWEKAVADPEAEIDRQVDSRLMLPDLRDKLDRGWLETFFQSPTFARIRSAEKEYREYDFITAAKLENGAETLVQGVADLVLEFADHIEILDYKTDRSKTAGQLVQAYRPQLLLYARAIGRRFAKPVTKLTLYSFALGREIDLDTESPQDENLLKPKIIP